MAHYDIEARAPGTATKDQMRVMLQNLLAERFKLAVGRETGRRQSLPSRWRSRGCWAGAATRIRRAIRCDDAVSGCRRREKWRAEERSQTLPMPCGVIARLRRAAGVAQDRRAQCDAGDVGGVDAGADWAVDVSKAGDRPNGARRDVRLYVVEWTQVVSNDVKLPGQTRREMSRTAGCAGERSSSAGVEGGVGQGAGGGARDHVEQPTAN